MTSLIQQPGHTNQECYLGEGENSEYRNLL